MYYFSYGMNTNPSQMSWRCPTSQSLGKAMLTGFKFEFKKHATIEPCIGGIVYGVLWDITEIDEESLDQLEGFPNYYTKKIVTVNHNGNLVPAMTYMMFQNEKLSAPAQSYYDMVKEGYLEHDIPVTQLRLARDRTPVIRNLYGNY
jgi:hypothetical protein